MNKNQKAVFWVLIGCLLIILFLVFWVLVTPLVIKLNSESGKCSIDQRFTFSVVIWLQDNIVYTVRVFGVELNTNDRGKPEKPRKKKRNKYKSWTSRARLTLLKEMGRNILIKELHVDMDTDDVVLNAQLMPLTYFMTNNRLNRVFRINFQGEVLIKFMAELRLYKVLATLIKNSLKR